MKPIALLSTVAVAMCISTAAQDSPKSWELHLNSGVNSSVLLYQETGESASRRGALDPVLGVAWRRMIASRMAIRAGVNLRTTTVRYSLEPPMADALSLQGGTVMRQSVGFDLPLIVDVDLVKPEQATGLRWLIGAVLQYDMEQIDHLQNAGDATALARVDQPTIYFGLLTGFELDFPLSAGGRILLAPQVAMGMPDRSPFALTDDSPSSSLLTGGLRLSYVPGQGSRLAASNEGSGKNRLLVGTGGRSQARSLHLMYERSILDHGYLDLMATATAGYGFFGGTASTGFTASFGGRTHAIDVGLAAGFHIDEAALAPIGELGYRLRLANDFVGRICFVHWPIFGSEYLPHSIGVSVGKAF